MDQQTRLEQEHYTLRAAYQLVRDDLQKRARMRKAVDAEVSHIVDALLIVEDRIRMLEVAPNE